jgi:chemotaxis signal transduction protein
MSSEHLIVTCADAAFALPIDKVLEVVRMVGLTAVLPRAPRYCLGAIDYHGRLVPLFDLQARLGLGAPRRVGDLLDARIVLVEERQQLVGYVVDAVNELTDREPQALTSDVSSLGGLVMGSVRWHEQETALVLDLRPGVLCPLRVGEKLRRLLQPSGPPPTPEPGSPMAAAPTLTEELPPTSSDPSEQ